MLLQDVVDLLLAQLDAQFRESVLEVGRSNLLRLIHIKTAKQTFDTLLSQELVDWECRCDELVVVDQAVVVTVALADNLVDLGLAQTHVRGGDSRLELVNLDSATHVLVDFVELFTEALELIGVQHLDQNGEARPSEGGSALEVL